MAGKDERPIPGLSEAHALFLLMVGELAVLPVSSYRVSQKYREFTGKKVDSGVQIRSQPMNSARNCSGLRGKFPARANRELRSAHQGKDSDFQGTCCARSGRTVSRCLSESPAYPAQAEVRRRRRRHRDLRHQTGGALPRTHSHQHGSAREWRRQVGRSRCEGVHPRPA